MTPKQQVEHRALLTDLMKIAHGLGTDYGNAELLTHVARIEKWIDHQINIEVSKAIQPFANVTVTRNYPRKKDRLT